MNPLKTVCSYCINFHRKSPYKKEVARDITPGPVRKENTMATLKTGKNSKGGNGLLFMI